MVAVLQEALGAASWDLQGALQDPRLLLEKYSEELLQLVRDKVDRL